MKKIFLLFAGILAVPVYVFAQSLPDSTIKKIDRLFKKWDNAHTPGCMVGIVRNDSLVYSKGYGLASLEEHIPNTPESIYYMCSVSKQFTGYAIALLASQGKLHLDDDIHKYLPWMADFGRKITIRNLLNHTSGIRDDIALAFIAGLPFEGVLNQDLALQLLKQQRTLNFAPGEQFSYSNSNYVLLAEIVRVAGGRSFPSFTDSAIFKPLGMTSSRFVSSEKEIIKKRAASYTSADGRLFSNSNQNVYTLGDGGLFTNVGDMARWVMNFYSPKAGNGTAIHQLSEKGKLNNGKEISYALGIEVSGSGRWTQYSHGGSLAGYRTMVAVYPGLKTGFIVFCNAGDGETYAKTDQLAALLLPDSLKKANLPAMIQKDSAMAGLKNPATFKQLSGDYIIKNGYHLSFALKRGRLWMNGERLLVNKSGDTFFLFDNPEVRYVFHRSQKGLIVDLFSPDLAQPMRAVKIVPGKTLPDRELQKYAGAYYSPELECSYHIRLTNHQLYLTGGHQTDTKITLLGNDHLLTDRDFFGHLLVIRGAGNKIVGFEINSEELLHLRFNKIAE